MNPLFRIDFSISDSLKIVRKSVLIYDTIIGWLSIPFVVLRQVCKRQSEKGVSGREDMEKAFPPVLSDFNFIVVVLSFGKKHCLLHDGSLRGLP